MFTQAELKSQLNYDSITGIFTRKISKSNSVKINDVAGTKRKDEYLHISIFNKNYLAHRLAWLYVYGEMPKNMIDHINGIKDDNRIENLRDIIKKTNNQNQKIAHKRSKSKILGVDWKESHKKWCARISVNNKKKHLGYFDTAENAHQAYLEAKRKLHEGCTI